MWEHAARLRRPFTPDRLAAVAPLWLAVVVPEWLAAAARPRRVPVPWGQMLRAAMAICVPIALGLATGQRALGLLTAMGGLLGTVVDNGGPYGPRLLRVGSASVFGGAAGLVIGSTIHGRGWIAVLVLTAVAGVSALLSAGSGVGSVTGLQLLAYSSLGLSALGALRPWWHTALGFIVGTAWALLLTVPGWLRSPMAAETRSVAAVYRALAAQLRAVGTPGCSPARRNVTAALNTAYDAVVTARSTAGGRSRLLRRLMAILNQCNVIADAATRLDREGIRPPEAVSDAVGRLAATTRGRPVLTGIPPLPGSSPGTDELRGGLSGLEYVLSGSWAPTDTPPARPSLRGRLRVLAARVDGRLTVTFALRLMACIAVATVVSEVLPLQRSYWVVLTVAIVLKPDLGSVFARAVQRGAGTVIGAVLGAVILVIVPYGPWLIIPFALLAALLPYGRSRNFGLQAVFLTPLVVLLIDLLTRASWYLALDRLVDTLLGCAIALLIGYAPWPTSWQASLPGQFAETIGDVAEYLEDALATAPGAVQAHAAAQPAGSGSQTQPAGSSGPRQPATLERRSPLGRRAYRAMSDLSTEFERTMSEPRAVSRRATAWWPALVGLGDVTEAVTATAVAVSHGAPPPSPDAVRQAAAALRGVAAAVTADVAPPAAELPSDEALRPVTEATRAFLGVIASPKQPPAACDLQPAVVPPAGRPPG
jgi:uncharacterized membrane protein YccC